jgi:hypothetical protein
MRLKGKRPTEEPLAGSAYTMRLGYDRTNDGPGHGDVLPMFCHYLHPWPVTSPTPHLVYYMCPSGRTAGGVVCSTTVPVIRL